jgi:glucose/arabinose dehydrogenase
MKTNRSLLMTALTIALLVAACKKESIDSSAIRSTNQNSDIITKSAAIKVFAKNLENPRGLKWGPDGNLYVAEGGTGGKDSTVGSCEQVPAPIGPYYGSPKRGRISKITPDGKRTTLVNDLPSSQTSAAQGSLISGVADVAFLGNAMYAILAGAGCSHGVPSLDNGVVKVKSDGSWKLIADLSVFQKANPVKNPEPDDFEPDGTWYSMINVSGDLYAVEPNHGELDKITRKGEISRIVDISKFQGHIVPTALTYHDSNFYVGNLNPFPIAPGSSKVYKITTGGRITVWAEGFTTILGLAFDNKGRLYVLENTTNNPFPTPGTGDVIRVNKDGSRDIIASGLNLPTGMTFGPDGNLYVSNWGFGATPGDGQVLQIPVQD